jgi:hypothetical protein
VIGFVLALLELECRTLLLARQELHHFVVIFQVGFFIFAQGRPQTTVLLPNTSDY